MQNGCGRMWAAGWAMAAVGSLAGMQGLAQAKAQVVIDPVTRDAWVGYSDSGSFGIAPLYARWSDRGILDRLEGAFSPFGPHSGSSDGRQQTRPLLWQGRATVLRDNHIIYQENAAGEWSATDLAAAAEQPLGCREQAKNRCALLQIRDDGRGAPMLLTLDDAKLQVRFSGPNGFRSPVGAETQFAENDALFTFLFGLPLYWSASGEQLLASNLFGGADAQTQFSYLAMTAKEKITHRLTVPGLSQTYPFHQIFASNGQIYGLSASVPLVSATSSVAIVAVDEAFSAKPQTRLLADLRGYASVLFYGHLVEHGFLYLVHVTPGGNQLSAFDLARHTVQDLGPCQVPSSGGILLAQEEQGGSVWLACGRVVRELHSGRVVRELHATASVAGGAVSPTAGGADIVLAEAGNLLERFRPGRPPQQVGPYGSGSVPERALNVVWEASDGALCGVPPAPDRQVNVCRRGREWLDVDDGLPAPYEVRHTASGDWALSQSSQVYEVYVRRGDARWALVQAWPRAEGGELRPQLILQGSSDVALLDGKGAVWRWDGQHFNVGYPHPKVPFGGQPVIATDGLLYDACFTSLGLQLCAFAADGKRQPLHGHLPTGMQLTRVPALLLPLERGVLLASGTDTYVLRGASSIELHHLYGQFRTPRGEAGRLQLRGLGDGSVLLTAAVGARYFRYNGITLTQVPAAAGAEPRRPRTGLGGEAQVLPEVQTWQGRDGLWRTIHDPDTLTIDYSLEPVRALLGREGLRSNKVAGAVRLGGVLWLATAGGLWTCADSSGTPLATAGRWLPVTPVCQQRWVLPFISKLYSDGDRLIIWQGRRLLSLVPGAAGTGRDDIITALTPPPGASLAGARLSDDGLADPGDPSAQAVAALGAAEVDGQAAAVAWIAGDQLYELARGDRQARSEPLPAAAGIRAAVPSWVCAASGLYWFDQSTWHKLDGVPSCQRLARSGEQVLAVGEVQAWRCTKGQCAEELPLPKPFLEDTVVGTLAPDAGLFGLISGDRLYRLAAAGRQFEDITPMLQERSAVLSAAAALSSGIISLKGGGVLLPPSSLDSPASWRHLRLQ